MPSLTLGHKPVGKSTLSRAIKRGALSANRTETGSYLKRTSGRFSASVANPEAGH